MTKRHTPPAPTRSLPDGSWEHRLVYRRVREAVSSLPVHFRTETHISGIMATDLHTLNAVLGATIEEQVVRTLNHVRTTWDQDDEYPLYSFVRQPQTFPDVRLMRMSDVGLEIPKGIEPYPAKADQIADKPKYDGGGNFGRLARTGMMDAYKEKLNGISLCGIKATFWRQFLKAFQESTTDEQARLALERLRAKVQTTADLPSSKAQSALAILSELENLLGLP